MVKFIRGDKSYLNIDRDVNADFEIVDGMYIGAKRPANVNFLSESDMECLNTSVDRCRSLSFKQLTAQSHDEAWEKADNNGGISVYDIASAAGANIDMLKYIQINIENQNTFHGIER